MRKFLKIIKPALIFYLSVFILQLSFYFISPSFYVSNPKDLVIPSFIILTFVKYFGIVIALYVVWAILIGLFNHKIIHHRTSEKPPKLPCYSLLFMQFFLILLLVSWEVPGLLNNYPGTRDIPLIFTYGLLTLGIVLSAWLGLKKMYQFYNWTQSLFRLACLSATPILLTLLLLSPSSIDLKTANVSKNSTSDIILLGFDAVDGSSSFDLLQKHSKKWGGVVFDQAYTPLPLTHPAWNSILTGLYPKNHKVRYFFNSPYEPDNPNQYLGKILKAKNYHTVLAFDQPETSHFETKHGFDHNILSTIGWKAHLQAMVFNHFIFPAIWLNNRFIAKLSGDAFNYANLFNYDPNRFFNTTFANLDNSGQKGNFLALHTCFLHTPVKLYRKEIQAIPSYWKLSPQDFSFRKWPATGESYTSAPRGWINPYFLRRQSLLNFMDKLLNELGEKGYYKNNLVTILSDHGERFVKNKEIYGGVHGVDVETKLQMHIMLSFLSAKIKGEEVNHEPVSLIDIAPTVLSFLDISTETYSFDGLALLDKNSQVLDLPSRPIWVESMGYLDDTDEGIEFPQIGVQTLQKSLHYQQNGSVTIGKDYYQRIIPKKVIKDITQSDLQNLI